MDDFNSLGSLGHFPSLEEAMLAAEMDDALHGATEPLDWENPQVMRSEPRPGYVYKISGPLWTADAQIWRVSYIGPDENWTRDFDDSGSAQTACQADWDQREPLIQSPEL